MKKLASLFLIFVLSFMLAVPAFAEEDSFTSVVELDNLVSREVVTYDSYGYSFYFGDSYLKHTAYAPAVLKIKDPYNLMYYADVYYVDEELIHPEYYLNFGVERKPLGWDDITYSISEFDGSGNKIGTRDVKEFPDIDQYAERLVIKSGQITLTKPGTYLVQYSRWATLGGIEVIEILANSGAAEVTPQPIVGLGNFTKQKTYSNGTFSDVNEKEWYAGSVATCYELGLMEGKGNGKFDPQGNISLAEAITMAARVNKIYNGKGAAIENTGSRWYDGAVSYAIAQGIIMGNEFEEYTRPATRAELAYIFARALPESEYGKINDISELPDVDDSTKYSQEIFKLYNAGIVTGSDQNLTFKPNANISRAEVSAIITRVVQPANRRVIQ